MGEFLAIASIPPVVLGMFKLFIASCFNFSRSILVGHMSLEIYPLILEFPDFWNINFQNIPSCASSRFPRSLWLQLLFFFFISIPPLLLRVVDLYLSKVHFVLLCIDVVLSLGHCSTHLYFSPSVDVGVGLALCFYSALRSIIRRF